MKIRSFLLAAAVAIAGVGGAHAADFLNPTAAKTNFEAQFNATTVNYDYAAIGNSIKAAYGNWLTASKAVAVQYATTSSYTPDGSATGTYTVAKYNEWWTLNKFSTTISNVLANGTVNYTSPGYSPYSGTTTTIASAVTFTIDSVIGEASYVATKIGDMTASNNVLVGPDLDIVSYIQGIHFYQEVANGSMSGFTLHPPSPHGDSTVSVPGPEAGAGLAGLAMAGFGALVMRRRRQNEIAA